MVSSSCSDLPSRSPNSPTFASSPHVYLIYCSFAFVSPLHTNMLSIRYAHRSLVQGGVKIPDAGGEG